jgi:hypothetical protein
VACLVGIECTAASVYESLPWQREKGEEPTKILTVGDMGWRSDRIRPAASSKSGGGRSSMMRRLGCGRAKLEVGLGAVEGGGAQGAFYRAGGGAEWTKWRRLLVQWRLTPTV